MKSFQIKSDSLKLLLTFLRQYLIVDKLKGFSTSTGNEAQIITVTFQVEDEEDAEDVARQAFYDTLNDIWQMNPPSLALCDESGEEIVSFSSKN